MAATPTVPLIIDGRAVKSRSKTLKPVVNPANQRTTAKVPFATPVEVDRAVKGAKAAYQKWRHVPVAERARLMLRFQDLLKRDQKAIAKVLAADNGKTLEDAMGDVWRGIEVVEHACGAPSLMMGEAVEGIARGIDAHSILQPLGVCAGITPFNFPAMIPLWMFPLANVCGNAFILKPSEQVPLAPMRIAELYQEAGAPPGLLQVVHGGKDQVDRLLTHPDVKAVSFVGSVPVGEHVYRTGCDHLKRVQALAGAKNHMVIMPDADKDRAIAALAAAAVGAAGQRCMAISVAVLVGSAKRLLPDLAKAMSKLRPGVWSDPKADFGPMVSRAAKERVVALIAEGKKSGATCLLDGSRKSVAGHPKGNWIGPTLFSKVRPDMAIYREEVFGPVLVTLEVNTLDDALALVNASPYGNGTSIFTASGAAARRYQSGVEVGQVGVNLPIPVPPPFFSFTGWKGSFYGDLHAYGKQAVRFYTETKTILTRWPETGGGKAAPNMTISMK